MKDFIYQADIDSHQRSELSPRYAIPSCGISTVTEFKDKLHQGHFHGLKKMSCRREPGTSPRAFHSPDTRRKIQRAGLTGDKLAYDLAPSRSSHPTLEPTAVQLSHLNQSQESRLVVPGTRLQQP